MENNTVPQIRILHVVTVMDVGGIETTIMNYMRHINREAIQFDFLVHRSDKGYFDDEIKSLGGNIYHAPSFNLKNISAYNGFINQFFKDHKYDIVHSHLDALSYFPLKGAMNNGVKVRIAHSHVNGFDKNLTYPIRQVFKLMIPLSATHFMACSESAGKFMFGQRKFDILLNPIDINQFQFSQVVRNELREELAVDNKIVIGHVGRFDSAKNHEFILKLAGLLPSDKYCFVLIGTGILQDEIMQKAKSSKLHNILFLGVKDKVFNYLSAMDVFILPSHYEGLGIAAIEAQVNGLPTLVSDNVSRGVGITDNVQYLPLNVSEWVSRIEALQSTDRTVMNDEIKAYDIDVNTSWLTKFYLKLEAENK